jgi:predicted PurR-regulated permease PerM
MRQEGDLMDILSGVNIWETAGPLIVTIIILLVVGVILAIIVNRIERGMLKNILVSIIPLFLVIFVLGAITYLSGIWGSR